MPIYAIQVDDQTRQDPDVFKLTEEKQGPFSKRHCATQERRNRWKGSFCFLSGIFGLGGAAGLQSNLIRAASFIWACLSFDATYTSIKTLNQSPIASRVVLLTENAFASTAILGAFPDALINNMRNFLRNVPMERGSYSVIHSIENTIKGNPGMPIPCCQRPISFFLSRQPLETQIRTSDFVLPENAKFQLNSRRSQHAKQPCILYLVSNQDIDTVFSAGDYAIYPYREKELKLYINLDDAIDAYLDSHVEPASRADLKRRRR